jgi:hypothetical protein
VSGTLQDPSMPLRPGPHLETRIDLVLCFASPLIVTLPRKA